MRARSTSLTAVVAALALCVAPLATRTAGAQPAATDEARQHFTRGKQLFSAGKYREAIGEFSAADKLATSPLLQFNIALCHERLGERAEALRRYHLYLERAPDAANRAAVEEKIRRLEDEMKAASKPEPAPAPPAAGPVGPPPSIGAEADAEAAPPPPPAPKAAAPTGDPELDRAARVDIRRLRSERRAASAPPPPRVAGPPPPEPSSPSARPLTDDRGGKKKEKPIYKQWWFWVVAGVSAIVIINIATADSKSSDGDRTGLLPPGASRDMGQPGGAVLLRF